MPKDFFSLTLTETLCLLQQKEDDIIRDMEHTRYAATASLNSNPYLKKEYKPTDLFRLPTDRKVKPITKEEFVDSLNKMKNKLPFNVA